MVKAKQGISNILVRVRILAKVNTTIDKPHCIINEIVISDDYMAVNSKSVE